MREIKFRGYYVCKGNALYPEEKRWIYGSLGIQRDKCWIISKEENTSFRVAAETVGQYTDLKDKKRTKEYPEGQEIYDSDILEIADFTSLEHSGCFSTISFLYA